MSEEKDPLAAMQTIVETLDGFEPERQVRIILSAAILLGISEIDPVRGKPMLPGTRSVREGSGR